MKRLRRLETDDAISAAFSILMFVFLSSIFLVSLAVVRMLVIAFFAALSAFSVNYSALIREERSILAKFVSDDKTDVELLLVTRFVEPRIRPFTNSFL